MNLRIYIADRETTTHTLNEFKSAGMIEIGRKRIEIKDVEGLQEIARF